MRWSTLCFSCTWNPISLSLTIVPFVSLHWARSSVSADFDRSTWTGSRNVLGAHPSSISFFTYHQPLERFSETSTSSPDWRDTSPLSSATYDEIAKYFVPLGLFSLWADFSWIQASSIPVMVSSVSPVVSSPLEWLSFVSPGGCGAAALWECSAWVMFDIKFKFSLNISAMPTPTLNCLFVKTGAGVVFALIPGSEIVLPNRPGRGGLLLLDFRSSENIRLLGKVRRGSRPKKWMV